VPPARTIAATVATFPDRLFDLLAALACAVALSVSLATVEGLTSPYDGDHYRDVAQAQTALDGHPLGDPHYPGEWVWYNPLVPWIVAAGSAITGLPPAAFHVQAGPYVNLLAPTGFYLLGARLAGRGPAFAGLVIFLFFNCHADQALVCPTYSPWLFVATFAQGLFFLTLLAMTGASERSTGARAMVVGALAGLTFLAHTGPAVVLGAAALFLMPARLWAASAAAALVVASPFLYSIVWHYTLRVVNEMNMAWWPPATLAGFPSTLRANAVLIGAGLAGALVVRHRAVRVWLGVSVALTAYGLGRELAPALPAVVPTFHFWRYAVAALTLLAGAATWWVCQRVAGRHAAALLAAGAVAAVGVFLPQYRTRFDFVYGRSVAEGRPPTHEAVTAFLRKSTPLDAVVLGSRGASLQIIGPAGRRVVAVNANWSNPYIDNVRRVQDRDAMLDALKRHEADGFDRLADAYRVTHVVGVGAEECGQMIGAEVQLLYRFEDLCVFRRRDVK
jgi:hypothetical protein